MPVSVPTQDEIEELEHRAASALQQMEQQMAALDARVAALEDIDTTPPPDPGPDPEPPDLPDVPSVTVRMAGAAYVYDPAAGKDIGDYHDPSGRFVMRCVRVKRPDCRLVLDFRTTDTWQCVIFENSDPTNGNQPILAYEAIIGDGEPIPVTGHYGCSAWRWQSCPWPHPITPVEDLYERKLLPRHDGALGLGKCGGLTPITALPPPMSLCGFVAGMGGTGGRADIGCVTGWQAEYLCAPSDAMLQTVLWQGEAAFPWRYRDTQTGSIFDAIKAYPRASQHWGNGPSGQPQIYVSSGTGISCDTAHSPACYYLPFLLTGDPWFLEMQQSECVWHFIEIPRNPNTVVGSEQVRGVAWSLRTLLNTVDATPDDVPSWLLPRQIFADELERQRGLLQARQSDGWVYRDFAHLIDSYGRWQHAWWQHDYATAVIAWASLLHPEWSQQRDWMIEGIAGRNSPTSGWCSGYPTSYWTNTTNRNDWYPEGSFTTWAAAWDFNANHVYTDTPGGVCPTLQEMLSRNTTYDYFSAMVHALRLGQQAGSQQAAETLASIIEPWNAGLQSSVGFTEYKYCGAAA